MKHTALFSTRLLPLAALTLGLAPLAAHAQSTPTTKPTVITSVPYTISTGGNYIVGHNLFNASSGTSSAITINANNVNLDLNDYFVTGGGASGVIDIVGSSGVMIKNGTVANGQFGILYSGAGLRDEMLDKVTVTHCTDVGVEDGGAVMGGVIRHCVFSSIGTSNSGAGLFLSSGWRVQDCVIDTIPGGTGIYSAGKALLLGNTISNCTFGIYYDNADGEGKFLNNLLYNCTVPFTGGTNATGNN